jgi:hypothetical protein
MDQATAAQPGVDALHEGMLTGGTTAPATSAAADTEKKTSSIGDRVQPAAIGLLAIGVLLLLLSAALFWYGSQGTTPITGMPLLGTTSAGLLGVFVLAALFGRRAFVACLVWLLPLLPALAAIATIAAYVSGLAKTRWRACCDRRPRPPSSRCVSLRTYSRILKATRRSCWLRRRWIPPLQRGQRT